MIHHRPYIEDTIIGFCARTVEDFTACFGQIRGAHRPRRRLPERPAGKKPDTPREDAYAPQTLRRREHRGNFLGDPLYKPRTLVC